MNGAIKSVAKAVFPLILIGWGVAAIRLVLEFAAPAAAMFFGVYIVMPIAFAYFGFMTPRFHGWRWRLVPLAAVMVAATVWLLPNAIAYTLAQFMEWDHGRFAADRSVPIADSAGRKILSGVGIAFGTGLAGTVWCTFCMTLLLWLPGRNKPPASTA